MKNKILEIKDAKTEQYYKEFMEYYTRLKDRIEYSKNFKSKLINKYYKHTTYKIHVDILKWFMNKYEDNYKIKICYYNKSYPYISVIYDNEEVVVYYYRDHKIRLGKYETEIDAILKNINYVVYFRTQLDDSGVKDIIYNSFLFDMVQEDKERFLENDYFHWANKIMENYNKQSNKYKRRKYE